MAGQNSCTSAGETGSFFDTPLRNSCVAGSGILAAGVKACVALAVPETTGCVAVAAIVLPIAAVLCAPATDVPACMGPTAVLVAAQLPDMALEIMSPATVGAAAKPLSMDSNMLIACEKKSPNVAPVTGTIAKTIKDMNTVCQLNTA